MWIIMWLKSDERRAWTATRWGIARKKHAPMLQTEPSYAHIDRDTKLILAFMRYSEYIRGCRSTSVTSNGIKTRLEFRCADHPRPRSMQYHPRTDPCESRLTFCSPARWERITFWVFGFCLRRAYVGHSASTWPEIARIWPNFSYHISEPSFI